MTAANVVVTEASTRIDVGKGMGTLAVHGRPVPIRKNDRRR